MRLAVSLAIAATIAAYTGAWRSVPLTVETVTRLEQVLEQAKRGMR